MPILKVPMIHRGSRPRESKNFRKAVRMSTLEDKIRRHRNKKRIWRRAVKRLDSLVRYDASLTIAIRADTLAPVA